MDESAYVVLATGRQTPFAGRVEDLLSTQALVFDELHFKPGDIKTGDWKVTVLEELFDWRGVSFGVPFKHLAIWEDRPELATRYVEYGEDWGLTTHVTLVTEGQMDMFDPTAAQGGA